MCVDKEAELLVLSEGICHCRLNLTCRCSQMLTEMTGMKVNVLFPSFHPFINCLNFSEALRLCPMIQMMCIRDVLKLFFFSCLQIQCYYAGLVSHIPLAHYSQAHLLAHVCLCTCISL